MVSARISLLSATRLALAFFVSCAFAISSVGAVAPTCTVTLDPGDSIQTAIDAATAGDVICLNPGNYPQTSRINVTQEVTITRTGCDPDVITERTAGDALTEAIVDGQDSVDRVFYIQDDNVKLQCLEIKDGTGDMIYATSGFSTSNIVIKNNIIHGASGDEAIQLKWSPNALIQYNDVYDTVGDGINLSEDSDGGQILMNRVHDIHSPDAAIYIYDSINTTIQGNLVYDVHNNDGIKLGNKNGSDTAKVGGTIDSNIIAQTAQDSITVYMSDTTVSNNKMTTSSSGNGAIFLSYAVDNVDINNNLVINNTASNGMKIGGGGVPTNVLVNNNCIEGNTFGLTFNGGPSLDAENNWWGAADGPSSSGPGTGDGVSANVDFDPFLTECTLDPIVDNNNDGIPDSEDDPLDLSTSSSSSLTGGGGGVQGSRYRKMNLIRYLLGLGNAGYGDVGVAPAGFGGPGPGGGTGELTNDQLISMCEVRKHIDQLQFFDIVEFMAENYARVYDVAEETILDVLENGTGCDVVEAAQAMQKAREEQALAQAEAERQAEILAAIEARKPKPVEFAVDSDGYPVSSDMIWNACIRNYQVFIGDQNKPINCRRYHEGHTWEHPDTLVSFKWTDRMGKHIGVHGKLVATYQVPDPIFTAMTQETEQGQFVTRFVLPEQMSTQTLAQRVKGFIGKLAVREAVVELAQTAVQTIVTNIEDIVPTTTVLSEEAQLTQ